MVEPIEMTLVVGAYNMARELPRTLFTLSRDYQRDIKNLTYRILVVDNGSDEPLDEAALREIMPDLRISRIVNAVSSPASAINDAVRQTDTPYIGLIIDGARMASPGMLGFAATALRLDPDAIVGTYACLLGNGLQKDTMTEGYDQAAEDALLDTVPWRANGYRLFDISVFAGSSRAGWNRLPVESNACFLSRAFWDELGGLDERFTSPGGGFVNIDFWQRALAARKRAPWMILGESTFHQFHGGAATNTPDNAVRRAMRLEYERIHGEKFAPIRRRARVIGHAPAPRWGLPRET